MALDPVDLLLQRITANGGHWPPKSEAKVWKRVATWRAFLESAREKLAEIAGWNTKDRPYKVDPLAARIADARADFLWGEDPRIRAPRDTDQERLDEILTDNTDFVGGLHDAERMIAGEGETWWRVYVDRDVANVPLLEWHPRDSVFPLYIGPRLMAVALITVLERPGNRGPYFRHLEIHTEGTVEHVVFEGSANRLGKTVDLAEVEATADLAEALELDEETGRAAWDHGLPMLMGRLVNKRRRGNVANPAVSDFDAIVDYLLDLNEAQTVGGENMRLTAKKRVVVPASSIRTTPSDAPGVELVDRGDGSMVPASGKPLFDAGEDVLVVDPVDAELGKGDGSSPFTVLEYSFDAEPLIAWKRDLVETALTRVGITPQWIGVVSDKDGLALSGTALRFKLVPTTTAGRRWARTWDEELPNRILPCMALVDALSQDDGGLGVDWADPESPFTVERANPLPTDELEDATIESTLVGARVRSRWTSIKRQHPDWTDEQVQDELDRIDEDAPPASALAGFGV